MLNSDPISWTSHLQKSVAQFTSKAEYYAAGHASRAIVWLRELLDQLGFRKPEPNPLLCDNNSAISMVLNLVFHEKAKHIRTKHHYIRTKHHFIRTGKRHCQDDQGSVRRPTGRWFNQASTDGLLSAEQSRICVRPATSVKAIGNRQQAIGSATSVKRFKLK